MRLFFAVELPAAIQAALGRLNPGDASRDYRWADPAMMHITLAFLGQQPAAQLGPLKAIGTQAAAASRAAVLRLGAPGSFGQRSAPRVLWIGLDGDLAALQALQSRLETGLTEAGFPAAEERPFRPHITLARRRESARGGAPPGWPPVRPFMGSTEFPMQRLTLFESRLSPHGATYINLAEFNLAGAPPDQGRR